MSDRPDNAAEISPDAFPRQMRLLLTLPPREIALFKAIVESYDNLATLRTEDPRRHRLCLYFSSDTESDVRSMLESLRPRFSIGEIATGTGD